MIIGNNEGIEAGIQADLEAIHELERQNTGIFKVLKQPSRHDLLKELRSKLYQIFIFTGHSGSNDNQDIGWIELSETDNLKITDLKLALREAITGGLQLCIFNSCDGLGLAKQLNQLQLPLAIVMREPVPDDVAAKFLRVFLEHYSGGESFFQSFREARHCLEGFNHQYPHVYWLPTVCTGLLGEPPMWSELITNQVNDKVIKIEEEGINDTEGIGQQKSWKRWLFPVGVPLVLISTFIIHELIDRTTPPPLSPELFSLGEKKLTPDAVFRNQPNCINNIAQKDRGIQKFQQQQFEQAAESFQNYVQQCYADPEAIIYLSNAQAATKGNPIKIAASVPIGNLVGEAQEILRGVAQAQYEINQQDGINGRPLQVMIANDDTFEDRDLLDKVEVVAKNLTQNSDILGVIGHYTTDATLEAGQIYNLENLVVISPTSTAIRKQGQFTNNVFRTPPTDAVAGKKLVRYMDAQNYYKAAIVYESNSEYSNSLSETVGKSLDMLPQGNIVHKCNLSSPNFSASQCVKNASNKGADVLALFPSSQLPTYVQNIVSQNYNLQFLGGRSLPLLAGDAVYGGKILNEVGEEVRGMVVAVPWHPNFQNTASTTFINTAKQLWKTESVNWRTASSYDATQALVKGLKQLGNKPTREGLKQVLSSNDFSIQGATGTVEFDGGDRKMKTENQNELGILVQVQCNDNNCNFVPLDY
ncbi:MAG: ABC transporter substrate-binding protein [Microcoleaceae cyanobacterium]